MFNFTHARQILPQVWHLPDFFLDPELVRTSYRTAQQPWTSQYPDRLLTPWGSNAKIESALQQAPELIKSVTGHTVATQVGYASLDLSGSRIMMHRLHPEIGAYIQVYMGSSSLDLNTVFCGNSDVNAADTPDYADISEFHAQDLVSVDYRFNHAWLMINQPRCFFGTAHRVPANQVRETLCFHFAAELPRST